MLQLILLLFESGLRAYYGELAWVNKRGSLVISVKLPNSEQGAVFAGRIAQAIPGAPGGPQLPEVFSWVGRHARGFKNDAAQLFFYILLQHQPIIFG